MSKKETYLKEFIIEYDYFGLSSSAEVKRRIWKSESYYKCFLNASAQEVDIRQLTEEGISYWIDMSAGTNTPLAQILGQAIENKLGTQQL